MFKEFKEFAVKGNVLDMAVGVIMGAAAWIAKVCFIVFLILAVLAFLKKSK